MSNFKRKKNRKFELVSTPNASVEWLVRGVHNLKQWQAIGLALPYFLLVTTLDIMWGDELILVLLYLPIIAMMAIRMSLKVAINFALVCSFVWLADDIFVTATEGGPNVSKLIAAFVHFAAFVVIAVVVSRLKIALHNEFLRARYDFLTGLPNMQMFYAEAQVLFEDKRKSERPLSMVFIDCDNFKTVNDTMGHEEGNRVLQTVAEELETKTRQQDCTARFGGDEFVALFPDTNLKDSQAIVENLQECLLKRMTENGWPVTFSIGIANYSKAPENIEQAVKTADELMYDCKNESKNGIAVKQAT